MKYRKSRQKNMYLHDTPLENLFIGEYLAKAPGDYIKVYLMERMYAEMDQCQDVDLIGKQLNLETKDVEQANKYWSDKGLIIIKEGEIIFKELKSMMFGFEEADDMAQDNEDSPLVDKGLAKVFEAIESNWGQMLDGSKMQEVSSWVKDYNADYDLIIRAIVYCKERSKENINYLRSVVIGWLDAGCSSKEDVEKYLADRDQRYYQYRKIFNEIGLPGNPGEAHKAIMDRWFDDWHFNMDRIMEACKKATGIANPNLNYVNAILETWAKEAESQGRDVNKKTVVNKQILNEYLQELRDKEIKEAEAHKEELYAKLPRLEEIEKEIAGLRPRATRALLDGNVEEAEAIRRNIEGLEMDKAVLLTENNFDIDYMDVKFKCDLCKDTCISDDGGDCTCIRERIQEAEKWQILKMNQQ